MQLLTNKLVRKALILNHLIILGSKFPIMTYYDHYSFESATSKKGWFHPFLTALCIWAVYGLLVTAKPPQTWGLEMIGRETALEVFQK